MSSQICQITISKRRLYFFNPVETCHSQFLSNKPKGSEALKAIVCVGIGGAFFKLIMSRSEVHIQSSVFTPNMCHLSDSIIVASTEDHWWLSTSYILKTDCVEVTTRFVMLPPSVCSSSVCHFRYFCFDTIRRRFRGSHVKWQQHVVGVWSWTKHNKSVQLVCNYFF